MKRLFKFLINLALALIAVAITFVVLFFMTPSWQKAVVKKALDQDPERKWLVESVRIQPGTIEFGKLQVLEGQVGAEVQQAYLSGPIWMSPVTGVVQIDEGRIRGLLVDLQSLEVGDLSSENWRTLIEQVQNDRAFWVERTNLILGKLSSSGLNVHVRDVQVDGQILFPGNEQIWIRWLIVEADSRDLSKTHLEPGGQISGTEL